MKLRSPNRRHGIFIARTAFSLAVAVFIPLLVYAGAPSWWSQRGVIVSGANADDYTPANQGQLKNIAKAAMAEMDVKLPGGAGATVHELVDSWSNPATQPNDFVPVNLGQLKNVAKPFYDRLIAAGLVDFYPWLSSTSSPNDFAVANIGQVKKLFGFQAALNPIDDPLQDRLAAGQRSGNFALLPGAVWFWGNRFGADSSFQSTYPRRLTELSGVKSVSAGDDHRVVLAGNGSVLTWGKNNYGQLGDGTNLDRNTPLAVPDLANITSAKAGGAHTLALQQDGTILAWGDNYYGQLGNGDNVASATSVQVVGMSGVRKIAAGPQRSVALKEDGTVWTWGYDYYINGEDISHNTPAQVSDLTDVVDIAAGYEHTVAVKADGTVWAWGLNYSNQIGNGNGWWVVQEVPAQVPNLANVVKVASGFGHTLALLNDGTVWAWGSNSFGELGDGTSQVRQAPVQVSGLTDVIAIAANYPFSLAMKSDDTVWVWGDGASGAPPGADLHVPQPVVLGLLDSNGNEMDDRWENSYFGNLDQLATADYDGDGISNLQEYIYRTDPTDYYNGTLLLLEKLSGDNQVAGSGAFLASPLVVRVSNSEGQALANAPVTFSSWGSFSPDGDSASLVDWSLTVRSDASGLALVYYQTSLADDVEVETITAQAQSGSGTATTEFMATTDPIRYYDGITPVLTIISGANQSAVPGYYTSAALIVEVRDSAGNLLRNAPVTLSVASGTGYLNLSRDPNSPGSTTLIVRTDANGRIMAYYMPTTGSGPSQITITPTGAAPGSSIAATGKTLDPAGDEDNDGKNNQDESKLGTNPAVFNLFSEHHYDGHAETPHTSSDPLPWVFYTETLTGAPEAWEGMTVKAAVVFDSGGTENNWVVDDYASINGQQFVALGYDLIYDVSDKWNATETNTLTATSDITGGVFCAAYKVILSVELPVDMITPAGDPVGAPVSGGDGSGAVPDGANEFTYSTASNGVLTLKLKAKVSAVSTFGQGVLDKFRFQVDAVGTSTMTWDPANPGGKPTANGNVLTATVTFSGLPQSNSAFGRKNARVTIDGHKVAEAACEVFFPRDAKNHPAPDAGFSPNWFYYWNQTGAGYANAVYLNVPGEYGETPAMLEWSPTMTWDKREVWISDAARTMSTRRDGSGQTVTGIDLFANVVRHEQRHTEQIAEADSMLGSLNGRPGSIWEKGWSWNKGLFSHNHYNLGADGGAGVAGTDDDGDGVTDEISDRSEVGYAGSDDTLLDTNFNDIVDSFSYNNVETDAANREVVAEDSHVHDDWGSPGKQHGTGNYED